MLEPPSEHWQIDREQPMHHIIWLFCVFVLLLIGCENRSAPTSSPTTSPPISSRPATTPLVQDALSPEQQLLGIWVANDVDAKIGEVKIKLTFLEYDGMKLAAWSDIPFVGQVRDKKGSYEVQGNIVSSEAIRGGTSVEFWFEDEDLIIKYKDGKTVRFHKE